MAMDMHTDTEPSGNGSTSTSNGSEQFGAKAQRHTPRRPATRDDAATVTAYATRLAEILGGVSPRQRRQAMDVLAAMESRQYHDTVGGLKLAATLCSDINDIGAARAVLAAVLEADEAGRGVRPEVRSVVHATVTAQLAQEAPTAPQGARGGKAK